MAPGPLLREDTAPRTLRLLERAAAPRRRPVPAPGGSAWQARLGRWIDRLLAP